MRRRIAGILLHPTSLPGRFGIGDLGPGLDRFLDWAQAAGQRLWQTLPLGPPVMGGCPYTCLSAFAGSPMLISPELLAQEGLLEPEDLADLPDFPSGRVDFGAVEPWKQTLLRRSWHRFEQRASAALRSELEAFLEHPDQRGWLDDWTLFSALKTHYGEKLWQEWDAEIALRVPGALAEARRLLAGEIAFHGYLQWLFFRQWRRVRHEAHRRGIEIMGDLPIYVSTDSAEVWAHPQLFDLDEAGWPRHVAGVPPDYFSEDGQLWGNPLYRWERMAATGYRWWIERIAANLRLTDIVRIDHFRAFCDYWQVPAGETTARGGRWVDGPGIEIFDAIRAAFGTLPLVAEDLGAIHPGIEALRRRAGLPGMCVLQFGFHGAESTHARTTASARR
ncbi:MAG: 4-alpha-glucanotransferase [Thermoanaerobaculia bacterium]|nr:4-alpha-glucanotransferase [Thermoanaerobaculia bacterium]